jgi:DNA-binding response OmpR family regulator
MTSGESSNRIVPQGTASTGLPKILVVDDEVDLVNLLRYNLEKEGYQVETAFDGTTALAKITETLPDLIILDLMLPDRSGYDICRFIKRQPLTEAIPVIMLTARSAEFDRIQGFESGAEDYVVKPFSPKELVLRVKAMLGRTYKQDPAILGMKPLTFGRLMIDAAAYRVAVDGINVPVSPLEFSILLVLAQYPNRVWTRDQLLDAVWKGDAAEVFDRTVDANVKRLRAKLGEARDCIETVRGVGYRFTPTGVLGGVDAKSAPVAAMAR